MVKRTLQNHRKITQPIRSNTSNVNKVDLISNNTRLAVTEYVVIKVPRPNVIYLLEIILDARTTVKSPSINKNYYLLYTK